MYKGPIPVLIKCTECGMTWLTDYKVKAELELEGTPYKCPLCRDNEEEN